MADPRTIAEAIQDQRLAESIVYDDYETTVEIVESLLFLERSR